MITCMHAYTYIYIYTYICLYICIYVHPWFEPDISMPPFLSPPPLIPPPPPDPIFVMIPDPLNENRWLAYCKCSVCPATSWVIVWDRHGNKRDCCRKCLTVHMPME